MGGALRLWGEVNDLKKTYFFFNVNWIMRDKVTSVLIIPIETRLIVGGLRKCILTN